jgi:hypothetical protein
VERRWSTKRGVGGRRRVHNHQRVSKTRWWSFALVERWWSAERGVGGRRRGETTQKHTNESLKLVGGRWWSFTPVEGW